MLVAIAGDRHALDQLHDEVGPARFGSAGVEDLGDIGVVHQCQGLPLGFEAGDHLARIHARLDDLQGDLALDRLGLLGQEDRAHAAFAELLQQLVRADHLAEFLGRCVLLGRPNRGPFRGRGRSGRGLLQETPSLTERGQQGLDACRNSALPPQALSR